MDAEQPIEDSAQEEITPPETGVGASEDSSFTTADDLPPELEARYKSMQADYTRKTQELAEQRKEAEAALEFINALQDESQRADALRQLADFVGENEYLTAAGFEADAEDNEQEPMDDFGGLNDPRVDQLAAEWEDYKKSQQEKEILHEIETFTEGEMSRLGIEDDREQQAVLSIAATLDLDQNGLPQIDAAYKMLNDLFGEKQKSWIDSKKAPRQPLQGAAGEEDFDFSNEDERRKRMAALIEANQQ